MRQSAYISISLRRFARDRSSERGERRFPCDKSAGTDRPDGPAPRGSPIVAARAGRARASKGRTKRTSHAARAYVLAHGLFSLQGPRAEDLSAPTRLALQSFAENLRSSRECTSHSW